MFRKKLFEIKRQTGRVMPKNGPNFVALSQKVSFSWSLFKALRTSCLQQTFGHFAFVYLCSMQYRYQNLGILLQTQPRAVQSCWVYPRSWQVSSHSPLVMLETFAATAAASSVCSASLRFIVAWCHTFTKYYFHQRSNIFPPYLRKFSTFWANACSNSITC